ncbi:MAG TPA: class I tRNA ligase family protein, partial [Candidatus Paceibacterota bacterium]
RGGIFKKKVGYPADFIAEYIGQTRTWFYYMHAMGMLAFNQRSFNTVVSTGNILAADGSKMSKSKGNYTDPLMLLGQYGADAYRFYLVGSVVMQAEDFNFRDEEVKEVHNRVVGMLLNSYRFFELYKDAFDATIQVSDCRSVLDQWIQVRLNETALLMTSALDTYDTPRACRAIRTFTEDYSTWYIRRSRTRVKGGDDADKRCALAVQHHVLLTLSKLIAPIMPFLAEYMYRGLSAEEESVHLSLWPSTRAHRKSDEEMLVSMKRTRELVSFALEERTRACVRVRQPLRKLALKDKTLEKEEAFLALLRDEVNVKEIVFDPIIEGEVMLDTTITPELKEEGTFRELVRHVQDLRKAAKLEPKEMAVLSVSTSPEGKAFIERNAEALRNATTLSSVAFVDVPGESITLDEKAFVFALRRN